MKLILLSLLLLASCGIKRETVDILNGKDGTSCSVSEALDESHTLVVGALITCTDGSSQIVLNGSDGQNGVDGIQGEQGNSCTISRHEGEDFVTITCGDQVLAIHDGQDGADGINANGCTLTPLLNNGGQGNKFQLTCGSVSTVFTGV